LQFQTEMERDAAREPEDRRLAFRVGIHLGDVIVEERDIYGDGVNVAARLEALAEPGGIVVSGVVHENVRGRVACAFEDMGDQTVKNIARPVRTYRVVPAANAARDSLHETLSLPDKPSIAVLAFTNLSGDPEQEYFSEGLADDLINALSRNRSLFVIARNSSFTYRGRSVDVRQVARDLGVRYVVEGSVRRAAPRVRVNAQLIDATVGNHIWGERFDRALEDIFALQDEITLAVAMAIGPAVDEAEQHRALRRPPENLSAWEAYHRGWWHAQKYSVPDIAPAREFLIRAINLDPTLALAHAGLAYLYVIESGHHGLRPFEEAARLATEHARMAVRLDPNDANAHGIFALTLFASGDLKAALDIADRALSISPNCALAHQVRGLSLTHDGQPAKGREGLRMAMRLDPRTMNLPLTAMIAMGYYFEHDYENAVVILRRTLADNPNNPPGLRWMAAALGQLGRMVEASRALNAAVEKTPDAFRHYTQNRAPWFRAENYEHMLDGLRKASWQG
jgi:adenylate cyclase